VWLAGRELELRPKEFDLLALLIAEAGWAVPREQIMAEVWDEHWFGSTKTLDMHIAALRRKLGEQPERPGRITTLRGVATAWGGHEAPHPGAILATTAVAVVLFGLPLALAVQHLYHSEAVVRLEREATRATTAVPASFGASGDPVELPRPSAGTRLALYGRDGRLVTGSGPAAMDAPARAALSGRVAERTVGGTIVVAVPVADEELVVGVVRPAVPTAAVDARVRRAWLAMAALAAGAVAVAGLVARVLAGRPLRVRVEGDLPPVRASTAAVTQVMDVLVGNAAEHRGGDGYGAGPGRPRRAGRRGQRREPGRGRGPGAGLCPPRRGSCRPRDRAGPGPLAGRGRRRAAPTPARRAARRVRAPAPRRPGRRGVATSRAEDMLGVEGLPGGGLVGRISGGLGGWEKSKSLAKLPRWGASSRTRGRWSGRPSVRGSMRAPPRKRSSMNLR
jgi:hypothetical protein